MNIDAMTAGYEMNALIAEKIFGTPWLAVLPDYSADIAADYSVHLKACSWIFSKRSAYLGALDDIMQHRAQSKGLAGNYIVKYPDILMFYEVGDYSRAALKVIQGEQAWQTN